MDRNHGHGHAHGFGHDINIQMNASELEKLSPEERWRVEHQMMHEKHRGHESMHGWMIIILIAAVLIAQVVLVEWKKRHFRSYQNASLLGMWLIPVGMCFFNHWWRFIIIWLIFTVITFLVMLKSCQKPVAGTTPRLVYKWFYLIYMLSYGIGVVGYAIIIMTILGVNLIFAAKPHTWLDAGLLMLFYGLYYGVLGRDVAEIITDKMACIIGYYTPTGVPVRILEPDVCAVCGCKILVMDNSEAVVEKTYKLTCGHTFHEFCIRGWCIVGKRQTCPYCKEKVDLKRMFCNPWEKPHVFYGNFLDFIRYLVVWQPVIIGAVQVINYALGLE